MLYFGGALGLFLLVLWIFCIVDVILTDESACRNLPKPLWLILVILIPDIGSIIWLVAGRPTGHTRRASPAYERNPGRFPEYERPGRHIAQDQESDEEFLRRCRARAEEQRQQAKNKKRPDEGL